MSEEGLKKTKNQKIFIGSPIDVSPLHLFEFLDSIKKMADKNDTIGLAERLRELVPGYGEHETFIMQ